MAVTNEDAQERLLKLQLRLAQIEMREKAQKEFLPFVKHVWPEFIAGEHHRIIADKLERVANGDLKRLIINMPPRHSKSEFASFLFPAWFMGRAPHKKIIQATHTTELAVSFGRKTKNLIERADYQDIFDVKLAADSKASGRWDTDRGGMYYAVGVGSNLAGRGADLCVHPDTVVQTPSGASRAADIVPGDYVLGAGGFGRVRHVIRSRHTATVVLNDRLRLSDFHPVLTDHGWTSACFLREGGIVYVPNSMVDESYMVVKGDAIHDDELCARIQHLGDDAAAVPESERGKLYKLRGSGDYGRPAVGEVCEFYRGHGPGAVSEAYFEPVGQQRPVLPGELCLVGCGDTAEQSARQRVYQGVWQKVDGCAVGPGNGFDAGHGSAPCFCYGHGSRGGFDGRADEPRAVSCRAADAGGRGCVPLSQFSGVGQTWEIQQSRGASGAVRSVKNLWWVPVAIRAARRIEHGPRDFVNFHVEGSNTFVADSYLTHNCIVDDPHSEQTLMSNSGFDDAWDWYTGGPRQRLQPGGAIIVVMTRWHEKDLTGQLIRAQARDPMADQWEVVELPAIMPSGKSCWPEYWSLEDLERVKASIPPGKWNAQYQQNPTGDESSILRREWWKIWDKDKVPPLEYVIQSYDTAFSKRETADYSAITTWGVFRVDEGGPPALMLLDAKKGRWDFPELKREAWELYKFWEPETVIIEAKATGMPLTHELRQMGIPVVNFTPSRGNDKISRAHSIAPLFEAGMIYAPDEQWAHELIEECAAFPNGEYDDYVDSTTQALMRYRQGNFVSLPTDDWEVDEGAVVQPRVYYG
jgi:predicted phage terminase large subunit-like protein